MEVEFTMPESQGSSVTGRLMTLESVSYLHTMQGKKHLLYQSDSFEVFRK